MADPRRETILARVRQAQSTALLPESGARDLPRATLDSASPEVWRERLLEELEILGVAVHEAATGDEVVRAVKKLLPGPRLLAWDPARLPYGLGRLLENETWSGASSPREEKECAEIGLTAVDAAIAETGSLVLLSNATAPRTASLLPPVHIAVVRGADIVPTMGWWFERDRERIERASCVNVVTGPSRTADIELALTLGVHGPGVVVVVLGP